MSDSDDRTYQRDENSFDDSVVGKCHLCGKEASIKVGIWDRKHVMTYDDTMVWRMLFLCNDCNKKETCVNFDAVWNHIGY